MVYTGAPKIFKIVYIRVVMWLYAYHNVIFDMEEYIGQTHDDSIYRVSIASRGKN